MRPGVRKQAVETVLRRLGLQLDLKRVIVCRAHVAEERDGVVGAIGWHVRRATGKATECVVSDGTARRWASCVQVIARHQNVRTAGTGIAFGQYKVADQLGLNVDVELLHPAKLEIRGLGIKRTAKRASGRRRSDGLKSAGKTEACGRLAQHSGAVRGCKGAAGGGEGVGFAKK